ncbi:hypothetical protein TSMEX_001274 [Taenia solium]|eukprot:TsM_000309400 transcript=TsM_000309400 gene=TsM_000309400
MSNGDCSAKKSGPHGRRGQTVTSPWKMWKHLVRRKRVSISGLDKSIETRNAENVRSLRNKNFTVSELKSVNVIPHLPCKWNLSVQTEENTLRKANSSVSRMKSFEISKMVTLNLQPRICSLIESTVQAGVVTESTSTQTFDVRERKNRGLVIDASFQMYEPIPELKESRLSKSLKSDQSCKDMKGNSSKQSYLAGPPKTGCGDCQSGASSTVKFEDQVGENGCSGTSIVIAAVEEELNRITGLIKARYNSICSPNKRRRLDSRFGQPVADQHIFTDEMLQDATSELIKELERVKMKNDGENEVPLPPLAETVTQPMVKSGSAYREHGWVLGDGKTKHSESMCLESQIKSGLGQTTEVAVLHKTEQSNQEFGLAKCPKENPKLNIPESEDTLESDKFDWLGWVRQVTHDETLTPQQKDRELDLIVNTMIERQNHRIHGGPKADRRVE